MVDLTYAALLRHNYTIARESMRHLASSSDGTSTLLDSEAWKDIARVHQESRERFCKPVGSVGSEGSTRKLSSGLQSLPYSNTPSLARRRQEDSEPHTPSTSLQPEQEASSKRKRKLDSVFVGGESDEGGAIEDQSSYGNGIFELQSICGVEREAVQVESRHPKQKRSSSGSTSTPNGRVIWSTARSKDYVVPGNLPGAAAIMTKTKKRRLEFPSEDHNAPAEFLSARGATTGERMFGLFSKDDTNCADVPTAIQCYITTIKKRLLGKEVQLEQGGGDFGSTYVAITKGSSVRRSLRLLERNRRVEYNI